MEHEAVARGAPARGADLDVVVVGGGLAGLAAAGTLARRGRRVVCFEARAEPGGLSTTLEEDGYRIDLGPPVLFDVEELEAVFAALGAKLRSAVELVELDPVWGVVFPDWERVVLHRSVERTAAELERLGLGDADRYAELLARLEEVAGEIAEDRIRPPARGIGARLARLRGGRALFRLQSLHSLLGRSLRGERARAALGALARMHGLDPDAAPAEVALALRAIHKGGAWQVAGGSGRLGAALAEAARASGAEVRMGAAVTRILVADGRAHGVALEGGETVGARAIVSSCHAGATYTELLESSWAGRSAAAARRAVARLDLLGAPLQVAFAFDGREEPDLSLQFYVPPEAESEDALSSVRGADDVYLKGLFMSFVCPSLLDPSVARPGTTLARVIVPVPYRQALGEWRRIRDRCTDEAIAFADSRFLPGMRDRLVWRGTFTPQTLGGMLRLWRRSWAPALTVSQRESRRPAARSSFVRGLYLAGRSTRPGLAPGDSARSGLLAAELCDADLA